MIRYQAGRSITSHLLLRHQPATTSITNSTNKISSTPTATTTSTSASTTKTPTTQKPSTTITKVQPSATKDTPATTPKNINTIKITNQDNTNTPESPCNNTLDKSTNTSSISNCQQPQSSTHIPWLPIISIFLALAFVVFLVWLIITIKKRIEATKKYNDTPEHFIQNQQISLNQQSNLKNNTIKTLKKYTDQDCLIEQKTQYGGLFYQLSFKNAQNSAFSAVYWTKQLKTDCYFEVEIDTLDSEIEIGFVNTSHYGNLESGIETKIGRVGVSLNSQGNLQVYGETKYQYRWNLEYGDVIGMGLTKIQGNKRVWITKNGILMNPPAQEEVQQWITKQELASYDRDAYNNTEMSKSQNQSKKKDADLSKRRVALPGSEDFSYYAVVASWEVTGDQMGKSKRGGQIFGIKTNDACTKVRVNVGGKVFRLRDDNLKSGLLADSIEKIAMCNWLPCY